MTFSIVARCAETGMFGVAVSSSSPAVAARCAHALAGVGAAASQNITDPALGTRLLELMALGASATQAIEVLRGSDPDMAFRQLSAVDAAGGSAIYSGELTLGIWGEARDRDVACAGNLLADPGLPAAMVDTFKASTGPLGDRLLAAMHAALAAGGEAGPVHSAGLRLVRDLVWPVADLRVDWTEGCPVVALSEVWAIYQPQLEDYVTRAVNPGSARGNAYKEREQDDRG